MSVFLFSQLALAQTPPIYVTLWFDTEDYILPQSDDAAKRLAEMLTRLGIKATFKVVGEKARVLEQRGRKDVIAALKKHEIGYHSNYHSMHPTPAEYLQNTDWDEGVAEFYRREISGVQDIQRIFGQTPSCYGQPGSSWGPQSYPALQKMGINIYLDEADHVGIDDQPFYYGGMLNIFKMRSNVVRMDLFGENNLEKGKAKFLAAYEKLKAKGGGTISIYYHPCEWVHQEFWDGVNFSRGANPPRNEWKLPKTRTGEETEKAFRDFEEYVKFIKVQKGVRYVTANELKELYPERTFLPRITGDFRTSISEAVQNEIAFVQTGGVILSAAETFSLLTKLFQAMYLDDRGPVRPESLLGPTRAFVYDAAHPRPTKVSGAAFAQAVRDVAAFCQHQGRVPNEVWIGSKSISPQDYLATLGLYTRKLLDRLPAEIEIVAGKFTADKYVANDDPKIFNWVIHPEGFHAPKLMELAKLQAWTLKPAVMKK
ncbi:MAG TPA: polysaccharide deacetylase family protein [Blastocatellia bacterium]|nr:polysaccharide deacetylase family protein [Blastocatellia bacterium]